MILEAMAKINLGLDVVRKREDGYHDVRMIMQTISLCDKVELIRRAAPGIELHVNVPGIPADERNLVYKAAKMLMDEFNITDGLYIYLEKRIPSEAGLAGGSSDAAVTLEGMNQLFSLGLNELELMERGVRLGADVPYCIHRGTALAEGIGEILTELPQINGMHILVGKPDVSVSTALAYSGLNLPSIDRHPDIDGMLRCIESNDLDGMIKRMDNVFEKGIISRFPVIQDIKDFMESHGARKAMMSGSGPTVFGIYEDAEKMKQAEEALKESGLAKAVFAAETQGRNKR